MINKKTIRAIYEEDLTEVLLNLGLITSAEEKTIRCGLCGKIVDFNDIAGLTKSDGIITAFCNNEICVKTFIEKE